jgi:hypothetical protein
MVAATRRRFIGDLRGRWRHCMARTPGADNTPPPICTDGKAMQRRVAGEDTRVGIGLSC